MEKVPKELMEQFVIPHIALTTFKCRAKATAYIKSLKLDITIDQVVVLKLISLMPDISQQELANAIYRDKSNLSRMLEAMENKGYIKRELDLKSNRAVKKISLTQKGKDSSIEFAKIAKAVHKTAMAGISEEELKIMKSVMGKIRDNMDKNIGEIE